MAQIYTERPFSYFLCGIFEYRTILANMAFFCIFA